MLLFVALWFGATGVFRSSLFFRLLKGDFGYFVFFSVLSSCKLLDHVFISLDVDECRSNSTNNCEQLCVNVPSSFFCDCHDGYKLNADGYSCDGKTSLDIDLHYIFAVL